MTDHSENLPARVDDLPRSMIDIAEQFGLPVALKLMQNYGGRDMRFPIRPDDNHPIHAILGDTVAFKICFYLSGQNIYIPHGKVQNVRASVKALEARGLSRGQIAKELGISERWVRKTANGRPKADPRQIGLFDQD